jgi:hypothetical protein
MTFDPRSGLRPEGETPVQAVILVIAERAPQRFEIGSRTEEGHLE